MVRAKMRLMEITQHDPITHGDQKTLVFGAVYDHTIPEDQQFHKATPTGRFEMRVNNPAALEQFEIGKSYYVDFTPA